MDYEISYDVSKFWMLPSKSNSYFNWSFYLGC
jgi:hypothetical protein